MTSVIKSTLQKYYMIWNYNWGLSTSGMVNTSWNKETFKVTNKSHAGKSRDGQDSHWLCGATWQQWKDEGVRKFYRSWMHFTWHSHRKVWWFWGLAFSQMHECHHEKLCYLFGTCQAVEWTRAGNSTTSLDHWISNSFYCAPGKQRRKTHVMHCH